MESNAETSTKSKALPAVSVSQLDISKIHIWTLPPLRINGKPGQAHTQGLLVHQDGFFVTARRDDINPRRSLLLWLRCNPNSQKENCNGSNRTWTKIWDITPTQPASWSDILDHPGGFDTDGENLWIPISQSRRNGKTMLRKFPIRSLIDKGDATPAESIIINDHIGAIAVSRNPKRLFGANWDTMLVYELSVDGSSIQHFERNRFITNLPKWSIAVQDWKVHDGFLIASGLDKNYKLLASRPRSLIQLINAKTRQISAELRLPRRASGNFTREGMSVFNEHIWLLPDDLQEENELYRFSFNELLKARR
ncbi:MAG: DUF6454 family protein [Verrucomicrobiota bacterium]|jgi:hypothetical protein|nr:DUF6454 family protein [Verrucomicrobiota bacterium]